METSFSSLSFFPFQLSFFLFLLIYLPLSSFFTFLILSFPLLLFHFLFLSFILYVTTFFCFFLSVLCLLSFLTILSLPFYSFIFACESFVSMLGGSLFHRDILPPRVADGRDGLRLWRKAANILNKKSLIADKGMSSNLGVGRGATNQWP